MKISWMFIVGIIFIIYAGLHIYNKPDLFNELDKQTVLLWFHQLWFYEFMAILCFIGDTFYFKGQ